MILATNVTSEGYLRIALLIAMMCASPFVGLGMFLETMARPKLVTWAKRLSIGLLFFSVLMFAWAGIPDPSGLGLADILMLAAILFPGFVGALALWRDHKARSET